MSAKNNQTVVYWDENDAGASQPRATPQGQAARMLEAQADVNFSLSDAQQLSPKRIQNRIVRDIDNMSRSGSYLMNQAFPLYGMDAYEEIYHRMRGLRPAMEGSSLASESPVQALEGLTEDDMSVTTLKEKISPEKALGETLNNQQQIMSVAELVSNALRTDLMNSRSLMAWRGYNGVEGMIGRDGLTAHPKLATDHVITGVDFSDTANSKPQDVFSQAEEAISRDGNFNVRDVGAITAYVPTDVYWDLLRNDALEARISTDSTQTLDGTNELETTLSIDNVVELRTRVPRTNANGETVDESGTVVDFTNAEAENVLAPTDGAGDTKRNVVVGAFGRGAGVMPWFTDRLSDIIASVPTGQWSVNMTEGFLLQGWTGHDPAISWRKIAQEIGLELIEPDNYVVIQDV